MTPPTQSAEDGLLAWIERWSPADAELWATWRRTLPRATRSEVLLPLQAVLSGLVAFRQLENHPPNEGDRDFRPHLHAVGVGLEWASSLVEMLQQPDDQVRLLRPSMPRFKEPDESLEALRKSLRDALRINQRLLDLPVVDSGVFGSSYDFFLRDLARNAFFRPPEPLEFRSSLKNNSSHSVNSKLRST